jgi:hypothetical protein
MRLFFHKLTHWEYWPFKIVYIPIYFLWLYYSIKARTIFFFNASNPLIKNGGFFMESKKEIYDLIPQKYYPKTELIKENQDFADVTRILNESAITFPFIVKPDIGLRGSAVKKIYSLQELKTYHQKANFDYLIQDCIPYENEIGVFYVRFPNEPHGKITGIVGKEFLIVTGNGKSTIRQLLLENPRFEMQLKTLQKEYKSKLNEVLQDGEKYNLVPFGNHCRGSKFIDASNLITDKLNKTIDNMCLEIDGFYFGRIDLMYNSFEELEKGEKFLLVEVNGAASEPTHIYDPKHSIFFAWKELAKHITYMYKISIINHRENGVPYLKYKEGMKQYNLYIEHNNKINNF